MSKNIIIQEDGANRNFTADKLRTKLFSNKDASSCNWVPLDEVKVTEKVITAAGTYNASDEGYHGYDVVTVRGMLGERGKVKTKYIKENGLYKAKDEGLSGYSRVNVNVKYSISAKERIDPLDPSYDPLDPYGDDLLVSTDNEDNITETKLAHHILVDTPPDKLEYRVGEPIDLTGAVVRGYLKNGMPYKEQSYAKSIIPHDQLTVRRDSDIFRTYDGFVAHTAVPEMSTDVRAGYETSPTTYGKLELTNHEYIEFHGNFVWVLHDVWWKDNVTDTPWSCIVQLLTDDIDAYVVKRYDRARDYVLTIRPFYKYERCYDGNYDYVSTVREDFSKYNPRDGFVNPDDRPLYLSSFAMNPFTGNASTSKYQPSEYLDNGGFYDYNASCSFSHALNDKKLTSNIINNRAYALPILLNLLYGGEGIENKSKVYVSWPREGDGKILTTDFDITLIG